MCCPPVFTEPLGLANTGQVGRHLLLLVGGVVEYILDVAERDHHPACTWHGVDLDVAHDENPVSHLLDEIALLDRVRVGDVSRTILEDQDSRIHVLERPADSVHLLHEFYAVHCSSLC